MIAREPPDEEQAIKHLQQLSHALQGRDLLVRVVEPLSGPPFVRAISWAAPVLEEKVLAARVGGEWFFCWSWAERICPVDQIREAARRVAHVLTPVGETEEA